MDRNIDVSMIRLCKKYRFALTATNPHNNNTVTIELIMALTLANTCTSKPRLALRVTRPKIDTATKMMMENKIISTEAFLSFFFHVAGSISQVDFFLNKNKKTPTATNAINIDTAIVVSSPARKLFFVRSFSNESNTMSSARLAIETESSP